MLVASLPHTMSARAGGARRGRRGARPLRLCLFYAGRSSNTSAGVPVFMRRVCMSCRVACVLLHNLFETDACAHGCCCGRQGKLLRPARSLKPSYTRLPCQSSGESYRVMLL